METIYYHLNATRITLGRDQKASGGEGIRCTVIPQKQHPVQNGGTVLDFEAYRRALTGEATPTAQDREPPKQERAPKGPSLWLVVDLCISAAVVCCAALAALGFFLI